MKSLLFLIANNPGSPVALGAALNVDANHGSLSRPTIRGFYPKGRQTGENVHHLPRVQPRHQHRPPASPLRGIVLDGHQHPQHQYIANPLPRAGSRATTICIAHRLKAGTRARQDHRDSLLLVAAGLQHRYHSGVGLSLAASGEVTSMHDNLLRAPPRH